MTTVLVTGGAGFIGSHIVDAYLFAGYQVIVLDNLSHGKWSNIARAKHAISSGIQNPSLVLPLKRGGGLVLLELDIRNKQDVERIFSQYKPQIVIHCAAHISVQESIKYPQFDWEVNVGGTKNVVEAIKKYPVEQVVFLSSGGAIYGDADEIPTPETAVLQPKSPYGEHKLKAEALLVRELLDSTRISVLRLSNVYGARQPAEGGGVIAKIVDCIAHNAIFYLSGDGEQVRDFIHVADVVSAVFCALQSKKNGVFNISTGVGVSLAEVISIVEQIAQKQLNIEKKAQVSGEVKTSILSPNLAKKELSWTPVTSLSNGLKALVYPNG